MGKITPSNKEFALLATFNREGFDLLGEECLLYTVLDSVEDSSNGKLHNYDNPIKLHVVFEENEVKLKSRNVNTETDGARVAFLKLPDVELPTNLKDSILEVMAFYNNNSKYVIRRVYGQVNTIYLKVEVVPYRESKSYAIEDNKKKEEIIDHGYLKKSKEFLKRD